MNEQKELYFLMVDDEANILAALSRELRDWAQTHDLTIRTFTSPLKALAFVYENGNSIVLIISDLKMPEMKGSDFLLEINKKLPDIMTMLLTGYSETEEVIKAVRAGIFSYILKPWDSQYLINEIDKAFQFWLSREQNRIYLRNVESELIWAGELQKAILKPNLPKSTGVEFKASYKPVPGLYCGGDYYDVIYIGTDRYLLLLGDVEGHGVRAAIVTAMLKTVIFSEYVCYQINKQFSVSAFLQWLNERITFELKNVPSIFITFFVGVIDIKNQTFRYANAGHNHPFIVRANGTVDELGLSGIGLGYQGTVIHNEQEIKINKDDTIFLYTDGLCDCGYLKSKDISLIDILRRVPYGPEYHKQLIQTVLQAAEVDNFSDDVAIVSARIL